MSCSLLKNLSSKETTMSADSVVTLLGVLAWPLTVLVIALLFRRELKRAFGRLAQLRYGEFEASFERKLHRAEAELRVDAPAAPTGPKAAAPGKVLKESDRGSASARPTAAETEALYRLAIIDPISAVRAAWQRLERKLREAAFLIGLAERAHSLPWNDLSHLLRERGLLPASVPSGLDHLRALYASADDPEDAGLLSADQARRYLDLALPMISELDAARVGRAAASPAATEG
jgi:hypothetical protein